MSGTVFTVIILITGVMILFAGLFYLRRGQADTNSGQIYGIANIIGAILAVAALLKILLTGF